MVKKDHENMNDFFYFIFFLLRMTYLLQTTLYTLVANTLIIM